MSRSFVRHPAVRRALLGLGVVAASFALVACGDEAEDGAAPAPTASATQGAGGGGDDAPHDVDRAACDALAPAVQAAFPGIALIEDATAYQAGGGALLGEGCRIMVRGTAAELPPFVEVAATLRGVLEAGGWTEDVRYAADGPAGTMSVFVDAADGIAVLAASVAPNDPTACPADQIIGECLDGLEPSTVTVQGEVVIGIGGAAGS